MKLTCGLCFHRCALDEGQAGFCRARQNQGGVIVPLNYGRLTALALDPIEKKPLRRFYPGSMILSAGSFGCNMSCFFCQNHEISMADEGIQTVRVSPAQLAEKARELIPRGNIGVAYTYNEPLVGFEFVKDCAALIREQGMKNVLVTNGMLTEPYLQELLGLIDAANIDLKGFTEGWYRRLGGDLDTVKRSIELTAQSCHLEVTALIVPGENDSVEEMRRLSGWLAGIDPEIPLHISRFFPRRHALDYPATPVETIRRLVGEAQKRLRFVYAGNI